MFFTMLVASMGRIVFGASHVAAFPLSTRDTAASFTLWAYGDSGIGGFPVVYIDGEDGLWWHHQQLPLTCCQGVPM